MNITKEDLIKIRKHYMYALYEKIHSFKIFDRRNNHFLKKRMQ